MAFEQSKREFDIIVFGASGFTGKYLTEHVAKVNNEEHLKWAVAGRSASKLRKVLEEVSSVTGKDVKDIPLIEADVSDEGSLASMCARTRVILTTVGPYILYGEAVVKACIENGTHCLDVSGEPLYLEKMQLKYNDAAEKAGVYILGAAGFDSIPCEMGIQFLQSKFDGDVNSVETFLKGKPGPHGGVYNSGTWESALHVRCNFKELRNVRKQLFDKRIPKNNHPLASRYFFYDQDINHWCLTLPITDRTVVRRTQHYNYHHRNMRPVQMNSYLVLPNIFAGFLMIVMAAVFGLLSLFGFGRKLLSEHPKLFSLGLFSKSGPTRQQVEGFKFDMVLVGKGYPEKLAQPSDQHADPPSKKLIVNVHGPEPGYVTTPICMLEAALSVLREGEKLPGKGGVLTPGAALKDTTLIERLEKRGLTFSIIGTE